MNTVQHSSLCQTPAGLDEQILRTIAGQTVDDQIRAQDLHAGRDQLHIFLHSKYVERVFLIADCQVCPFQNMQKLELYALNILIVQIMQGLKHPLLVFSGKSEDRVDDHFQTSRTQTVHRILKDGQGITAPDIAGSILMHGLKSKLHPDRLDLI